jgi:hypothetical protein
VARALCALAPAGAQVTGRALLDGADVLAQRSPRVVWVPQDALGALDPVQSVGSHLAEALEVHRGVRGPARQGELAALLASVGLEGDMVATGVLVDDLFGSQLVPLMLTVDNAGRAETAEQCRGSKKTRSQTPTTPMLIWHARVSMVSMLASPLSSVEAVWGASQCPTPSVNPFATVQYGASPLWDTAVSGAEMEATSVGTSFSVHTPMFSDASRVNPRTSNNPVSDFSKLEETV